MKQQFDFHIHTKLSDGEYSVYELINEIRKENIKYFSITDHDTINSSNEMLKEDLTGLNYITGVEISTILDNKYKLHILGYNYDRDSIYLKELNERVRNKRIDRIYQMASELKKVHNIDIQKSEIDDIVNNNYVVGKPHIARLLVNKGYASNIGEAIYNYLDDLDIKVSYRIDFKEVADAIHKSNGVVIWAHPRKVEDKYNIDFTSILDRLISLGLDGVEVYNSLHTVSDSNRYMHVCKNKNLLISGGSDYHGPHVKENVKLGVLNKDKNNDIINIDKISIYKKE